jgi:hypothetical protein
MDEKYEQKSLKKRHRCQISTWKTVSHHMSLGNCKLKHHDMPLYTCIRMTKI